MAFLGATVFFAAVGPCRVMSFERKKKVSTKKTSHTNISIIDPPLGGSMRVA